MLNSREKTNLIHQLIPFIILILIQVIPFLGVYNEPSSTLFLTLLGSYAFVLIAYLYASRFTYGFVYYALLGLSTVASVYSGFDSQLFLQSDAVFTISIFALMFGQVILHGMRVHAFTTITSDVVRGGMGIGYDSENAKMCLEIAYRENTRLAFVLAISSALMLITAPTIGIAMSIVIALLLLLTVFFTCGFISADISQMQRLASVDTKPTYWAVVTALGIQAAAIVLTGVESLNGMIDAIVVFPAVVILGFGGIITLLNTCVKK